MRSEVDLQAHLLRMRVTAVAALVVVAGAVIASIALPYRGSVVASPLTVTVVAAAAGLWIGFSANRDAASRLVKIRRSFAVHRNEGRLLREHWLVYAVILVRLGVMVLAGLVAALWGLGPPYGIWLQILGGLMVALTWPTARKSQLLLGRARALLDND